MESKELPEKDFIPDPYFSRILPEDKGGCFVWLLFWLLALAIVATALE